MARKTFVLPALVIGPADVNRLLLEMEALEDYMRQASFRKGAVKLPKTTRTLDELAELNGADLAAAGDRLALQAFLESLQQHAPVVHISFASEPSAAFTVKIVNWMRANISSYVLVQIGLQPSIAAGCIVRTTNKVFDMSLGRFLRTQRHLLTDALHKAGHNGANRMARLPDPAIVKTAADTADPVPPPAGAVRPMAVTVEAGQ